MLKLGRSISYSTCIGGDVLQKVVNWSVRPESERHSLSSFRLKLVLIEIKLVLFWNERKDFPL